MDMIERVARTLARDDGSKTTGPTRHKASDEFQWDPGHRYMEAYVEKHWRKHVNAACKVIEAMRDPTEQMVEAGLDANPRGPTVWPDYEAGKIWQAMIDAALTQA